MPKNSMMLARTRRMLARSLPRKSRYGLTVMVILPRKTRKRKART